MSAMTGGAGESVKPGNREQPTGFGAGVFFDSTRLASPLSVTS